MATPPGAQLPEWFILIRAMVSTMLGTALIIGAITDDSPRPFIVAGGLVLLGYPLADLAFWKRS